MIGRIRFVSLVLYCAPLMLVASQTAIASDGWSLDKQEDGIKIYPRPVEGYGIKEFKDVAVADAAIEEIVSLLRDSNRFKRR